MICLSMKKISVAITILVLTRLLCIQGEIKADNVADLLPLGDWPQIQLALPSFGLSYMNLNDKS